MAIFKFIKNFSLPLFLALIAFVAEPALAQPGVKHSRRANNNANRHHANAYSDSNSATFTHGIDGNFSYDEYLAYLENLSDSVETTQYQKSTSKSKSAASSRDDELFLERNSPSVRCAMDTHQNDDRKFQSLIDRHYQKRAHEIRMMHNTEHRDLISNASVHKRTKETAAYLYSCKNVLSSNTCQTISGYQVIFINIMKENRAMHHDFKTRVMTQMAIRYHHCRSRYNY